MKREAENAPRRPSKPKKTRAHPETLPKVPEGIPRQDPWLGMRELRGPLVTVAVLALIELSPFLGFEVPNPPAIYFLAIVFSSLSGGWKGGFLSAAFTIVYAAYFYSIPGQPFAYEASELRKLVVLLFTTPAMVFLIHRWQSLHETRSALETHKLAEELAAARHAEEEHGRLAALVDSAEDAIYGKDLTGRITSWNHAAERLYGYPAGEAIGKNIALIVPAAKEEEQQMILRRIMMGQRVERLETIRRRKDGTTVHVKITVSPVKNAHGNVIGASVIARESTSP